MAKYEGFTVYRNVRNCDPLPLPLSIFSVEADNVESALSEFASRLNIIDGEVRGRFLYWTSEDAPMRLEAREVK